MERSHLNSGNYSSLNFQFFTKICIACGHILAVINIAITFWNRNFWMVIFHRVFMRSLRNQANLPNSLQQISNPCHANKESFELNEREYCDTQGMLALRFSLPPSWREIGNYWWSCQCYGCSMGQISSLKSDESEDLGSWRPNYFSQSTALCHVHRRKQPFFFSSPTIWSCR